MSRQTGVEGGKKQCHKMTLGSKIIQKSGILLERRLSVIDLFYSGPKSKVIGVIFVCNFCDLQFSTKGIKYMAFLECRNYS